ALNDFHGNLEPPAGTVRLPDGTVPAGGGAWLAAHVARLRAEEPDTVVVGAGDLLRLQRGGCRPDDPGCRPPGFAGARFTYLAANVLDRSGKTLLPGTWLKKVGGATIGFIG